MPVSLWNVAQANGNSLAPDCYSLCNQMSSGDKTFTPTAGMTVDVADSTNGITGTHDDLSGYSDEHDTNTGAYVETTAYRLPRYLRKPKTLQRHVSASSEALFFAH